MNPRVSVIVPAYRCERTVEESIRSALAQTIREIEVIAVDDGSDDGTPAILARLQAEDSRVRVITLPANGGVAAARNRAVEAARAELLAFLDSDDVWETDKLERQLDVMDRTGAALVYTAAACIDGDGKPTGKRFRVPETVTAGKLLSGNDIVTSTVLIRRGVYERHPMEHSRLHEDVISWYRILNDGAKAVGIDEPLARYRVTKGSKTGSKLRSAAMMWNTYRCLGVGPLRRTVCFAGYLLHGVRRYWL
jgi:teichuronic acid biosynthesis glycosyltransferase TuaG